MIFVLQSVDVFAKEKNTMYDNSELCSIDVTAKCDVDAKAYALMDVNTGTMLICSNEHEKLYPASVTKVMTLLLVCESIEKGELTLDKVITCSDTAAAKGGSQIWLESGEKMTVDELLRATVIYSANDACTLLAETVGGNEKNFVDMMNKRSEELGMKDTCFDNCTGLDDDTDKHKSSAYDIAIMSCALLKHDMIKDYTTIWMDSLRNGKTELVNTNKMIRYYSGATGLKTGTTGKAGCCVAASAERDGMELVAVVLGAPHSNERFAGARNLLDYGFANYEIYSPKADMSDLSRIKVNHGVSGYVEICSQKPKEVLVNKGTKNKTEQNIDICEELNAPVEKGKKVGTVKFTADKKIIATYDIITVDSIEKMTFLNAVKTIIKSLAFCS